MIDRVYLWICGGLGALITSGGGLLIKHMTNSRKHPCADKLVFEDVCEERGKSNELAHKHLKEGIDTAIARSKEQHDELKTDMRTGFDKLEVLIKNNGGR